MKTAESRAPARLQLVRSSSVTNEAKPLFVGSNTPSVLEKRRTRDDHPSDSPALRVVPVEEIPNPSVPPTDVPFKISWSPLSAELETAIVTVLRSPAPAGVSAHTAFHDKEHALGTIFASLPVCDAMALHRRLTIPAADDPVVKDFARLTRDRRDRLVRFLGDARRRAALAEHRP